VGPPYEVLQFDVAVQEPGAPAMLITFTVKYGADEETLHVLGCDRIIVEE
jgi:hypothetical protein